MTNHLYNVVDCKTPKCGNVLAVAYQGLDIGQVEIREYVPTGFSYQCPKCGQTHRYDPDESRLERFPFPPPQGWQNAFGLDPHQRKPIDPTKIH
jgi:predicted RNA-binding Zn-ribbon protein involved in translation (DUF1610 family)